MANTPRGPGGGFGGAFSGIVKRAPKTLPKNKIKSMPKESMKKTSGAQPKNQTKEGWTVVSKRPPAVQAVKQKSKSIYHKEAHVQTIEPKNTTFSMSKTPTPTPDSHKITFDPMKAAVSKTKRQLRANKKAKGIK